MDVAALTAAVQAVCPVDGVSIGVPGDRSTWRAAYRPEATADQRAAAANVLATWVDAPSAALTLEARLAALEARPEEAAHFTATAAVPALSVLGGGVVTLVGLVPARAGDVLKAGETIVVAPVNGLPSGAGVASARVTADGVVTVQLVTSVAISAGSPIAWNITALR